MQMPMRTSTQNQSQLLRTVAFSLLFYRSILQSYLKKIHKRTSCIKILKKKLTVDGARFHNYLAELRQRSRCYAIYTSRSIPTDTYSHFNVELLLITVSFSFIHICLPIFVGCSRSKPLVYKISALQRTSPIQNLVQILHSKKKLLSQIDSRIGFF